MTQHVLISVPTDRKPVISHSLPVRVIALSIPNPIEEPYGRLKRLRDSALVYLIRSNTLPYYCYAKDGKIPSRHPSRRLFTLVDGRRELTRGRLPEDMPPFTQLVLEHCHIGAA